MYNIQYTVIRTWTRLPSNGTAVIKHSALTLTAWIYFVIQLLFFQLQLQLTVPLREPTWTPDSLAWPLRRCFRCLRVEWWTAHYQQLLMLLLTHLMTSSWCRVDAGTTWRHIEPGWCGHWRRWRWELTRWVTVERWTQTDRWTGLTAVDDTYRRLSTRLYSLLSPAVAYQYCYFPDYYY